MVGFTTEGNLLRRSETSSGDLTGITNTITKASPRFNNVGGGPTTSGGDGVVPDINRNLKKHITQICHCCCFFPAAYFAVAYFSIARILMVLGMRWPDPLSICYHDEVGWRVVMGLLGLLVSVAEASAGGVSFR